jgi:hypothetical protein
MGISESWLWTTVVAHTESLAEEGSGGLSEGDLVWGAARGFPAWPGKLVGPVTDGDKVWVRWFGGDRALTQVSLQSLKTLSEGLEAHHRARKKFRKWVSFALRFIGDVTVFFLFITTYQKLDAQIYVNVTHNPFKFHHLYMHQSIGQQTFFVMNVASE